MLFTILTIMETVEITGMITVTYVMTLTPTTSVMTLTHLAAVQLMLMMIMFGPSKMDGFLKSQILET